MDMNNADIVEQLLELKDTEFKYSEKYYAQSNMDENIVKEQIQRNQRELNGYLAVLKKDLNNKEYTLAESNLPKFRAKKILNNINK